MKTLPIIDIAGTDFLVDLRRMEFREVANPANKITFYDFRDNGDHLVLLYDTETRNAYGGPGKKLAETGKVRIIRLQPLDQLDPFTYMLLQGRQDNRLQQLQRAAKLFHPSAESCAAQRKKTK
ncbi:hypothetical protein ACQ86N_22990 [Puia sp. P3]|uniref:hypothetical protein n=1 Tax=Puia sp. P3 TaxID=3423952 RepID=UPI003D67344E